MTHVVTLSEMDLQRLRLIVLDSDGTEALTFLKESILKPVEESLHKGMDTSKGRL